MDRNNQLHFFCEDKRLNRIHHWWGFSETVGSHTNTIMVLNIYLPFTPGFVVLTLIVLRYLKTITFFTFSSFSFLCFLCIWEPEDHKWKHLWSHKSFQKLYVYLIRLLQDILLNKVVQENGVALYIWILLFVNYL